MTPSEMRKLTIRRGIVWLEENKYTVISRKGDKWEVLSPRGNTATIAIYKLMTVFGEYKFEHKSMDKFKELEIHTLWVTENKCGWSENTLT